MPATFTWPNVQDAIYDAAKAAMPTCNVIWAFGANPAAMPAKPFAVLNLTTRDVQQGLQGRDEVSNTTTAGTVVYSHHRRHVVSVNVYSNSTWGTDHAVALLSALSRELRKDSRQLALRQAGCKVWPDGTVQDLTAMLDTRGESRAQCDLHVATLDGTTEAVGWIQTVDLSGIEVDGEPI